MTDMKNNTNQSKHVCSIIACIREFLRTAKRRSKRGVTLVEVLIVVSILALISGGVGVYALEKYREAQIRMAVTNAKEIRKMVGMWRSEGRGDECPTVSQLENDKVMDKGSDNVDPWGSAFEIRCDGDEIYVSSPGPDKKKGTEDDITEPGKKAKR